MRPRTPEGPRLADGHAEPARLEGAGRVLPLVLAPEVPQPQVRGQARQLEQRRAALAERHRLLGRGRAAAARGTGTSRAGAARSVSLVTARRDAREVVAHREHLAALLADGEQPPGLVAAAADGAFDVGHEHAWASVVGMWGIGGGRGAPGMGAPRSAGAADDGLLREAAFVFEDEPRVAAAGVFFSCAQRRVFHCSMAVSFRSARAGPAVGGTTPAAAESARHARDGVGRP